MVPTGRPAYGSDVVAFANRDDLPTMVQATIAHAQFESIHPFGDGNGRIGRALIGAILRRRGVTGNTVVPVASGPRPSPPRRPGPPCSGVFEWWAILGSNQ